MNDIVSTNWLYKNKKNKNLVILDCSWYLPSIMKNAYKEYKKEHIKNSFFFDIELISNKKTNLPHMLPSLNVFKKKINLFNIKKDTRVILYSKNDILGSSRVWWMFKYFGFKNISVLNGGLIKWIKEGKPVTNKISTKNQTLYKFNIEKNWLASKKDIEKNIGKKDFIIFDARNNDRFKGNESEPRKNLKLGNIPKSKNIFWKNVTNNGNLILSKKKIKQVFSRYDLSNKKLIFTCGSGISACVLCLSLNYSLDIKGSVYDGSWAEWGLIKK